jgi:hypothetical protein
MPAQYSQSRARGFAPLFRGPYPDQHMRVSDAERQAVADRLAEGFADGRLDQAEFDERAGLAMNAKTRADLAGLLDDLPDTGPHGARLPGTGAPAVRERPRRRPGSFLGFVLLVIIFLVAAHAAVHAAAALLWAGLIFAAVMFVATRAARGRARHDQ